MEAEESSSGFRKVQRKPPPTTRKRALHRSISEPEFVLHRIIEPGLSESTADDVRMKEEDSETLVSVKDLTTFYEALALPYQPEFRKSPTLQEFEKSRPLVFAPSSYGPNFSIPSPPPPGETYTVPTIIHGTWKEQALDVMLGETRLYGKIGLHCYNLEKGTNLQFLGLHEFANTGIFSCHLTLEAEDRNSTCTFEANIRYATENKDCLSVITTHCRPVPPPAEEEEECCQYGLDLLSVNEFFKGKMPNWLPEETTGELQYYEMKESEVEEHKEWLHLYAELALFTKLRMNPDEFLFSKPFELVKIIVQTREASVKVDNAVFYISFKTSIGQVCKGIIRRTTDGRPDHLSLEAKCVFDDSLSEMFDLSNDSNRCRMFD